MFKEPAKTGNARAAVEVKLLSDVEAAVHCDSRGLGRAV